MIIILMSTFSKTGSLTVKIHRFPLPGPDVQDAWPPGNNTRIILTDARYPAIDAFYLVRTSGN